MKGLTRARSPSRSTSDPVLSGPSLATPHATRPHRRPASEREPGPVGSLEKDPSLLGLRHLRSFARRALHEELNHLRTPRRANRHPDKVLAEPAKGSQLRLGSDQFGTMFIVVLAVVLHHGWGGAIGISSRPRAARIGIDSSSSRLHPRSASSSRSRARDAPSNSRTKRPGPSARALSSCTRAGSVSSAACTLACRKESKSTPAR